MQIINKSFYFFEYSRGPAEVVISFYMISSSLTIAIIIIIILLSLVRYLNEVDFREKMHLIVYTFISVILVSLVSFVGALTLALQKSKVHSMLLFLVSLAAGALLGDAFLHLLPEAAKKNGFGLSIGLVVLSGVVVFFVLEKIIHWHRCHHEHECVNCEEQKKKKQEIKSIAIMNLVGDGAHNLMDGILIAGSYFVSIPIGIATTVAVILHEVPQEIATAFQIMGLGKTISSGKNTIGQLQNKIKKLEIENIKLTERNQTIISNRKPGENYQQNTIHNLLHRLHLK